MTLAVVVATEQAGGSPDEGSLPSAELDLRDGAVLARLLGQLSSLGVRESHILCRPEDAATFRDGRRAVIESPGLAGDLTAISRVVRAARREHGPEPVLILHGDVVAHREVLKRVLVDDKAEALAVIARGRPRTDTPSRPVVRIEGDRVTSAGSPYHTVTDPNAVFRGVLYVSARRAGVLADVGKRLAGFVAGDPVRVAPIRHLRHDPAEFDADGRAGDDASERRRAKAQPGGRGPRWPGRAPAGGSGSGLAAGPGGGTGTLAEDETGAGPRTGGDGDPWAHRDPDPFGSTPTTGADAPALLLVGLSRAGLRVGARGVRVLICERVLTAWQARAAQVAVDSVDEDQEILAAAVKNNDGFFTTYAVSTYSRYIARWTARRGLTPNMVTSISMAVSVLAAVWFADGGRLSMIIGAVLLYFAFVLDCVDGQLARYTRQFSTLGAWLDATFDRAKEYTAFAGLAVGAAASGVGDVWGLAIAAMTLQTVRHLIDFSFGAARRPASAEPVPELPLSDPDDRLLDPPPAPPVAARGAGHLVVRLSARSERVVVMRWAKKVIVLPIGERFALISITAALFDARVTFLALLGWGAIAAAYTVTGRVLRSITK